MSMTLLKIAQLGHPVLRTKARPLEREDISTTETQTLIDNMVETMRDANGAGIAAPQVHESVRICVVELRAGSRHPDAPLIPLHVFINPQIIERSDELVEDWEGCLSITGLRGLVPRHRTITVEALNRGGEPFSLTVEGNFARFLQHEIDHLDGILYIDRMPDLRTLSGLDEYTKFWVQSDR
jgi:peptide deformylase